MTKRNNRLNPKVNIWVKRVIDGILRTATAADFYSEAIIFAPHSGGCPATDWSAPDEPDRPDFPIIFVKYALYSPQMIEKSDSIRLALATTAILGQPPSPALYPKLVLNF